MVVSAAAAIVTVVALSVTTSMTALIFSGPLAPFLPRALGLAVVGAAVSSLLISLATSLPGIKGSSQDIFGALLAVVAASLVARVTPQLPLDRVFLTVLALVAVTTLIIGIFFFALGTLRLSRLVRFLPYPVMGGFVAGSGWLLLTGGLRFMLGSPATLAALQAAAPLRWLPGVAFALMLLLATRRSKKPLLFPALVVGGLLLFYALALPAGATIAALQDAGWLLGPFPAGGILQFPRLAELGQVDWPAIVRETPGIVTVAALCSVALLLNAAGIELAADSDVDLEREMRAAGLGNIAAGLLGGMGGYHSFSQSMLALRMGADSRLVGVISSVLCLLIAVFGGGLLSLFPRVVVGGLIAYLGLSFLFEWVVESWRRLPVVDYAIVITILVVIANFGFLEGVVVGLIAAIVLFVVNYSWIDVVRTVATGRSVRSRVTRAAEEIAALRAAAGRVLLLDLQGFLFFGTAYNLQQRLQAWLSTGVSSAMRYVLLDFSAVSGLDTTATMSFIRIRDLARGANTSLIVIGAADGIRTRLARAGFGPQDGVRVEQDRDHALEWCEEQLLADAGPIAPRTLQTRLAEHAADEALVQTILAHLDLCTLPAGAVFVRQGAAADDLYWIASGRVTAQLTREDGEVLRLETMTGGRVVGELGFYLHQVRTADVVADEETIAYRLTRERLAQLEHEAPAAAAVLQSLLIRLLSERVTHLIGVVEASP